MELSLIVAAFLLGLGGMPHCAAMCAAPCNAITRGDRRASLAFQGARLLGYTTAGTLVAAGVSNIALLREAAPLTRPLWALVHAAALGLGAWMLVTGRQPQWRWGRAPAMLATSPSAGGWAVVKGPTLARSGASGLAWVAWPCGLLQSALLLAALANGPLGGAGVMAAFALASAPALWMWPQLMRRFGNGKARVRVVRAAGLLLAVASAWALVARVIAWCSV